MSEDVTGVITTVMGGICPVVVILACVAIIVYQFFRKRDD